MKCEWVHGGLVSLDDVEWCEFNGELVNCLIIGDRLMFRTV